VIARHLLGDAYPIKRLGSVVEFLDQKRRPVTESDRKPGPYPYYGANGQQGWIDDFIFDEPLILLAEDGGHFDSPDRGIAYRIDGKTWVNNHAHVLRPTAEVNIGFLCRLLENYDLTPFITGTTRGKLTKAGASEIPVIVPPLEEQRRIAAILDQAETLRTQRRQALAHLDTLTQSLFLDMFGDPVANPKNFDTGVLGDVCDLFNGYAFKSDDYVEVSNTLNCRMSNIRPNGEFSIEYHPKYLPDSFAEEFKRFLLRDGDVIIAMTDMASEVKILGVPTIVDTKGKAVLLNQRVGKLLMRDRADIDIPFLRQMLAQKYVKSFYQKFASGGVQINLGKGDLLSVPIVLPPLALQQTLATRIQAIEALKATHRTALAQLDALFASLQQRAFAGEL
jgi:type I restriction enzyme S subunit